MESSIKLTETLTQLDFFREIRHMKHYDVRDSLIGIKLELGEDGIGHYMVDHDPKTIKILVESTNSSKIATCLDKCRELAMKVIEMEK